MIYPDYKNSIPNVVSSIQTFFWVNNPNYLQHPIVTKFLKDNQPKTVISLFIDWLWYNFIKKYPESFLSKQLIWSITSTFPSTTAVAQTCRATGKTAQNHGISSWYFYLKEIEDQIVALKYITRKSKTPVDNYVDPKDIFPYGIFNDISYSTYIVNNELYRWSSYSNITLGWADNKLRYKDWDFSNYIELLNKALNKSYEENNKAYIYGYRPKFDDLSHTFWSWSKETLNHFSEMDKKIESRCKSIRKSNDVTIIISSDHGFMDWSSAKTLFLTEEIIDCLSQPPTWERRYLYFYVKPDKDEIFQRLMKDFLKWHGKLYKSEDLIKTGIFWLWWIHSEFRNRIWNYVLLMEDGRRCTFETQWIVPSEKIWDHWWLSADEMLCPLILIWNKNL